MLFQRGININIIINIINSNVIVIFFVKKLIILFIISIIGVKILIIVDMFKKITIIRIKITKRTNNKKIIPLGVIEGGPKRIRIRKN
jgi:hypothetical protein